MATSLSVFCLILRKGQFKEFDLKVFFIAYINLHKFTALINMQFCTKLVDDNTSSQIIQARKILQRYFPISDVYILQRVNQRNSV